jgi:hypothetical protein
MEQTYRDQRGAGQSRATIAKVQSKLIAIREEQGRAGRILLRYIANL